MDNDTTFLTISQIRFVVVLYYLFVDHISEAAYFSPNVRWHGWTELAWHSLTLGFPGNKNLHCCLNLLYYREKMPTLTVSSLEFLVVGRRAATCRFSSRPRCSPQMQWFMKGYLLLKRSSLSWYLKCFPTGLTLPIPQWDTKFKVNDPWRVFYIHTMVGRSKKRVCWNRRIAMFTGA